MYEQINCRLKQIRQTKKLSQYEIADKLNIKQPQWARWESGKLEISGKNIYHICKTLRISADWLLGLTDSAQPIFLDREVEDTIKNKKPLCG